MGLTQQLTNQGRVVGGYLTNGTVSAAKSDLVIQRAFTRQKLTRETVQVWEELTTEDGIAGVVGQAVARAVLPGFVGKAIGAGVGAAARSGRTVRVDWVDGKQSLIELPEKLFMVLCVLLEDRRKGSESTTTEVDMPAVAGPAGMSGGFMNLALSVLRGGRQEAAAAHPPSAARPDAAEQLTKLATLRDQGILTEDEFVTKKVEVLKRL